MARGAERYRYAKREDLPEFVELLSDPEVGRWLWFTPIAPDEVEAYFGPVLDAQAKELEAGIEPVASVFAVEDEGGSSLGHGAVVPVEGSPDGYEIGFQLIRSAWGRGIGTRLGQFLCAVSIFGYGAYRIEGRCLEGNDGSAAILRNLGLRHEGTLVNFRLRETARHTELLFGAPAAELDAASLRQVATTVGLLTD